MAVVPWTYNNPRVDKNKLPVQSFSFASKQVEIYQDLEADISVNKNTGLKLWDGAYFLAKFISDKIECHHVCIELGAGCGLVGMVAALYGAHVTITDLPETLKHTEHCVKSNIEKWKQTYRTDYTEKMNVKSLCWGDDFETSEQYDFILGSDVIYQKESCEPLLKTLRYLANRNSKIFISYKQRGLGEDYFFSLLEKYDFTKKDIPRDEMCEELQVSQYYIFQLVLQLK